MAWVEPPTVINRSRHKQEVRTVPPVYKHGWVEMSNRASQPGFLPITKDQMTNIPDLPPEFGTIVNDVQPDPEVQEIETKI